MSNTARQYSTGFVAFGTDVHEMSGPFKGAGWTARLAPDDRESGRIHGGMQIVLGAGGWTVAQRALDLINGSRQLMNGYPDLFPIHLIAHNEAEPDWMDKDERARLRDEQGMSQSGLPTACAIAARASRRRSWSYAIAKYAFSVGLYSVHPIDMQPSSRVSHPVSSYPSDHVLLSHAILAAFGAIEDLGLAVPAGHGRPSRIGGAWNPEVLADLEARLRQSRIDPHERVVWSVRGPARRIERRRPVPPGEGLSWTGGAVRDRTLTVADAIGYADFLRDRVAAHGVRDLTRSLSPYDAVNVQHLSRFLLLASLGFRVWEPRAARPSSSSNQETILREQGAPRA